MSHGLNGEGGRVLFGHRSMANFLQATKCTVHCTVHHQDALYFGGRFCGETMETRIYLRRVRSGVADPVGVGVLQHLALVVTGGGADQLFKVAQEVRLIGEPQVEGQL